MIDDREESPDRIKAIQEAALNPIIHQKLWDRYEGNLPSDETFRIHLLRDYKFTEGAVKDFISQFKRTIAFAKLGKSDKLFGHEEDKTSFNEEETMPTAEPMRTTTSEQHRPAIMQEPNTRIGDQRFEVIFTDGEIASVKFPTALKSSEWGAMVRKLLNVVAPEEKVQSRKNEE